MDSYIEILKNILKNNIDGFYDDIIKNLLFKIFDDYYSNRDKMKYNIDNIFKKYNINMYNLLKMKHILTTSDKLIFKRHKYDKREYIIFLLKKNNFILNKNETYKSIIDEILKNDVDCYTKFIKDYCHNRILNEKPELKKLKMIIIVIFVKMKNPYFFKNPYKCKNLYIVYIMSSKKITKLNEYFYMNPEGDVLKYKKYRIINGCKKLSSYNYSGKKENLYCNDHKLKKMVNFRKGYSYCEKHNTPYLKFCKECEKF